MRLGNPSRRIRHNPRVHAPLRARDPMRDSVTDLGGREISDYYSLTYGVEIRHKMGVTDS
jgi:hypothetical protein